MRWLAKPTSAISGASATTSPGSSTRSDGAPGTSPAHPPKPADALSATLIFVREQRPNRDPEKRDSEDPSRPPAAQQAAEQHPRQPGHGMVGKSGKQDAEDDRHRALKPRRKDQREDLGLVA